MKKLFALAFCAGLAASTFAEEVKAAANGATAQEPGSKYERRDENLMWPAFIGICNWPSSPDLIGLRLTLPFSTSQDSVTGIDLGFWGQSMYYEGIQINIIRNNVVDQAAAFQVGLYNSTGRSDLFGVQCGLWNETQSISGFQAGLVNTVGEARGFQVGLINRADTLYGFQVGLINVIRDAEIRFFPGVNIGF